MSRPKLGKKTVRLWFTVPAEEEIKWRQEWYKLFYGGTNMYQFIKENPDLNMREVCSALGKRAAAVKNFCKRVDLPIPAAPKKKKKKLVSK